METREPLVSVVMPTYNNARYLKETLASVFAQTYKNWELIVVDDGSTDETQAVLSPHSDRIILKRIENSGSARARNVGIQTAKGDLIAFLDSDDLWEPAKLERQVAFLQDHPENWLCYTDKIFIDDAGGEIDSMVQWDYPSGWIFEKMLAYNYISTSSLVMARRACFEKAGLFDENPVLRVSQDADLWTRIAYYHQVGFVDEKLVRYRYHAKGTSRNIEKVYAAQLYKCDKFKRLFGKERPGILPILRRRAFRAHSDFGRGFLYHRNIPAARQAFASALRLKPASITCLLGYGATFLVPVLNLRRKVKDLV